MVGDDVVELARDPHPLLVHGSLGQEGSLAGQLLGPLAQGREVRPPRAHVEADGRCGGNGD